MDRKIEKKFWTPKRVIFWSGLALVGIILVYMLLSIGSASRLNVDRDKLTVSTIHEGSFQEFIPVDGTVTPVTTVDLDAIEGGVIKHIVRESGDMVAPGDTIMILSNSSLELNVIQRETQIYDQLNNVRNTRIAIQQNSLSLKNQMADAHYLLETTKPQFKRDSLMHSQKLISDKEYQDSRSSYERAKKKWQVALASLRQDSLLREHQLRQLDESEGRLNRSLNVVENILNNLVVTAPIRGQITMPDLEIGQSVNQGQRMGQIDVLNNYEARVNIDEHYLTRIDTGLVGTFDFNEQNYKMKITKVYPSVNNGQFQVDMAFTGPSPEGLKPGQTLQIRLALGSSSKALLLARGGFYQSTGGNWVYVLDSSGDYAKRHDIQIGRQNPDYFEVLKGLKPGDKVVTSSYDNFGNNEVLVLR